MSEAPRNEAPQHETAKHETPLPDAPLTIGVLGGMGPAATVDFFAKLVAATPAERDQDHLRILIDNDPSVPDRSAAVAGRGPSLGPRLATMARGLVAAGAQLLVMPCNTAHAYAQAITTAAPGTPFLSLIEVTVEATLARVPDAEAVALLATDGTLASRLYDDAFEARGVRVLLPDAHEQPRVMAAIAAVKRGAADASARAALRSVAERLAGAGAAAVVAGCTEVPLLLRDGDVRLGDASVPVIASTDALVARTVAAARAGARAGTGAGAGAGTVAGAGAGAGAAAHDGEPRDGTAREGTVPDGRAG